MDISFNLFEQTSNLKDVDLMRVGIEDRKKLAGIAWQRKSG